MEKCLTQTSQRLQFLRNCVKWADLCLELQSSRLLTQVVSDFGRPLAVENQYGNQHEIVLYQNTIWYIN